MPEKKKQEYKMMFEKDKIRYRNQEEELKKKGFFTLEDGTKSTDYSKNTQNGPKNISITHNNQHQK